MSEHSLIIVLKYGEKLKEFDDISTERRQVGAPLSFTEKFRFPIWKIDRVEIISLYAVRKNSTNNIMDCIEVFRQAEKEIAESGKLSLTATVNLSCAREIVNEEIVYMD